MRKLLVLVLWSICATAFSADVTDTTWRLSRQVANGMIGGSATAISEHRFATAAHCVKETGVQVTLDRPGQKPITALAIAVNRISDVAILETQADVPVWATISERDLQPGDSMSGAGYGFDNEGLAYGSGTVIAWASDGKQRSSLIMESGDSGGSIFNAAGELAGVVSAVDGAEAYAGRNLAGHVYSAPASAIKRELQQYEVQCGGGGCGAGGSCGAGGCNMGGMARNSRNAIPPRGDRLTPVRPGPLVDIPKPEPKQTTQQPNNLDERLKKIEDALANMTCKPGQSGKDAQVDYDKIAAAISARLTHSATITLLDGTTKTQTKPLSEPLDFSQHKIALKSK